MPTATSGSSSTNDRWSRLLQTDFCPQLNRYVYWMKEPIGWFAAAAFVSLLVGAFLSPLGWALAAGLLAIIAGGLLFPWMAVRFTVCKLEPVIQELHEGEASQLLLTVINPMPIPLWGLAIDGYLTQQQAIESDSAAGFKRPEISLSGVPMFSQATFRLPIVAEYRGRYPIELPEVACAFPFGIWTAKRRLTTVQPVTIWPMLLQLKSLIDMGGRKHSDIGVGLRAGSHGEFLGVREFRRGDSLRSIHWVQSARTGELVVCERAAPQQQEVLIVVDTDGGPVGDRLEVRENLAWRVRIAASFVDLFDAQHIPFRLQIGSNGGISANLSMPRALDLLTTIPLDGFIPSESNSAGSKIRPQVIGAEVRIDAKPPLMAASSHAVDAHDANRYVGLSVSLAGIGRCGGTVQKTTVVDLDGDIRFQLFEFLREVGYVNAAA